MNTSDNIMSVSIEDEMKQSYLAYAMSVIVARALPDVRDGLKPVHRRILYAMKESGCDYNKPFRKSARIVGEVMGKYHPHGDSAIYEAMVRMAQDFSMSQMLVQGQGNFGSMDGDGAAAMRYTEARLNQVAHTMLEDLDKDTVDFQPNYDETLEEPSVLPSRFPNLLLNGAGGIAVGMATNIPPHNLGELLEACLALIKNPEMSGEELANIVLGPDFPTGAKIIGTGAIKQMYLTGRGSVIMRAKSEIVEKGKDKTMIVVSEIPYQVNKAALISKIAELHREKIVEGLSEVRDLSSREGVRIEIELKRDAQGDVVLNQLYKYTQLQTSFPANMIALNGGKPEMMTLKTMLDAFIAFREEVIRRRTVFELNKARDKAHVLVGLAIAVANLDKVIEMIKTSPDPQVAKERLTKEKWHARDVVPLVELIDEPDRKIVDGEYYYLSDTQAKAILDLRLHRLTGLERDKIHDELRGLGTEIKELLSILASREKLYGIMEKEFIEIKDKFAIPRRTEIEEGELDQNIEDLIAREEMVMTVTKTGYIKRVPLATYRAQRRGGKGRTGMSTHEEDYVTNLFVTSTHTPVLFFSDKGMVYKMKVYRLPIGSPQSAGKALVNLLPLDKDEKITTVLCLPENEEDCKDMTVMFATTSGGVRRNALSDFYNVMANGKIAMKLDEGDHLVDVKICTDEQDILLAGKSGKCLRFPVSDVRVFASRASTGVRGMKLAEGDTIISMSVLEHVKAESEKRDAYLRMALVKRRALSAGDPEEPTEIFDSGSLTMTLSGEEFSSMEQAEEFILTITKNGYGKRSSAYDYRITGRGGSGIANTDLSKKREVIASFPVMDTDEIMLVSDGGQIIRMPVRDIRIAGRPSQGVIVFRLAEGEEIVSVAAIADAGEDENLPEDSENGLLNAGEEVQNEEGSAPDTEE